MIRPGEPQSEGAPPFGNKWTIDWLFQIPHSAQYAWESRAYFGARGMEIATGSHMHIRDNIGMRQNCSARKTGVRFQCSLAELVNQALMLVFFLRSVLGYEHLAGGILAQAGCSQRPFQRGRCFHLFRCAIF